MQQQLFTEVLQKSFSEIRIFLGKRSWWSSVLVILQALTLQLYLQQALTQKFYWELSDLLKAAIFKNISERLLLQMLISLC